MLTNGSIISLLLRAGFEMIVHGVETHSLSGKEKVPGAVSGKIGAAGCHLGHE